MALQIYFGLIAPILLIPASGHPFLFLKQWKSSKKKNQLAPMIFSFTSGEALIHTTKLSSKK